MLASIELPCETTLEEYLLGSLEVGGPTGSRSRIRLDTLRGACRNCYTSSLLAPP